MTVLIYVDTSKQSEILHRNVIVDTGAAETWFEDNDVDCAGFRLSRFWFKSSRYAIALQCTR